jgi:hypothetical protein
MRPHGQHRAEAPCLPLPRDVLQPRARAVDYGGEHIHQRLRRSQSDHSRSRRPHDVPRQARHRRRIHDRPAQEMPHRPRAVCAEDCRAGSRQTLRRYSRAHRKFRSPIGPR